MYLRKQPYLINISIYVGSIITILFLFSGLAFDSINYLSQSIPGQGPGTWSYFGGKVSIFDRTNVTFIMLYPFSLFGLYLGGILYISMSTFLLQKTYKFIYSIREKKSKYEIQDLIFLFPYYIAHILLPGKESIVFFGIILIFYLCNVLNRSMALNDIYFTKTELLTLTLSILITCLIRPPLILMLAPSILISYPFIRKNIITILKNKVNLNYLITIKVVIGILSIGLIILIINPSYYSESIIQVARMSIYSPGTLSTGVITRDLVENLYLILPLTISTFVMGFPLIPYITNNSLCILLGSFYGLTNIYFYYLIIKKVKFSRDIRTIAILFIPLLLGGYIISIALAFNTGAGLRYVVPYIEILWLISSLKPNHKIKLSNSGFNI